MQVHQSTLTTERLILRPFIIADSDRVMQLAGKKEIYQTTLNMPHPYEQGMAEKWISTHASKFYNELGIVFAITLKETGELIGTINLDGTIEHKQAELGYWLGLQYWNKGYCTEASKEIIRYGFEVLNLHKITSRHMQCNPSSGRVMQKSGMTKEGELVDHIFKDDRFHTILVYGLVNFNSVIPN